jgi:hypothetical protein
MESFWWMLGTEPADMLGGTILLYRLEDLVPWQRRPGGEASDQPWHPRPLVGPMAEREPAADDGDG